MGTIGGDRIEGNRTSTTTTIALLCAVLIGITNIYVSSIYQGTTGFATIFVLMLLTALAVPVIYLLPSHAIKFATYIFLGFSTYWAVGAATNLAQTGDIFDSFQFLPVTIFAMANAIVVLIAIVDSPRYGYGFSGMGFAIIAYNTMETRNLDYVGGKPDILLLALALSSLIPLLWCYLLAGTARNLKFSATKRFSATVTTGILTLSIFIMLVAVIAISQLPIIDELNKVYVFLSMTRGDLLRLSWYYLLANTVFVMVAFFANRLVLNAFDIEKEITRAGEVIYRRPVAEAKEEVNEEEKNPYRPLIHEMKGFQSDFKKGKLNRLTCVQALGKFRNELELLVSKYEYGSKDDAEEILQQIEVNVEFTFR